MGSSAVPASLEMLCSLLSLCLEGGEGRECWSFLLSRDESPFVCKSQSRRICLAVFTALRVMSLLWAVSALFLLPSKNAGFLYLSAPEPLWSCPFLLSKCTGEASECPGWAGLGWCFLQIGREGAARSLEPAPADSRNCFHLAFPYCSWAVFLT